MIKTFRLKTKETPILIDEYFGLYYTGMDFDKNYYYKIELTEHELFLFLIKHPYFEISDD